MPKLPTRQLDVCITVDFEPDCPPFLWTWRGITDGAPRLLELFAHETVQATYFTTGDTARRYPEAIRALMAAGHELACHGMTHRAFPDLSDDEAAFEIRESLKILRAFAPVTSFRAPYLRFPDRLLPLLQRNSISLDSSQAKYKGRISPSIDGLTRIPASVTSSVLRLPSAIRDPVLRQLASPVVLFVHPWEFVDLSRVPIRWDCRFRTGLPALDCLRSVIQLFKAKGARFCRMDELAGVRAS